MEVVLLEWTAIPEQKSVGGELYESCKQLAISRGRRMTTSEIIIEHLGEGWWNREFVSNDLKVLLDRLMEDYGFGWEAAKLEIRSEATKSWLREALEKIKSVSKWTELYRVLESIQRECGVEENFYTFLTKATTSIPHSSAQ